MHINIASLEAAVRAISGAIAWGLSEFELLIDSRTVHKWLSDALSASGPTKVLGLSEALVKQRNSKGAAFEGGSYVGGFSREQSRRSYSSSQPLADSQKLQIS